VLGKRREELTRESFFILRGIPYDYSEIKKREEEFIFQHINEGNNFVWIPRELNWQISAMTHSVFDRLSGVQEQNRGPNDIIAEKVFARLKEKLDSCHDVTKYVDKYVAHSATPESRAIENVESTQITLKQLWDAHQTIYEVAEYLSFVLFSESHFPLISKHPNTFDNWDISFLGQQDINRLETIYQNYWKITDNWRLEAVDKCWRWIES